ncbi:TIGR04283 family arsenosugar biosynthesis glycosyltransferase [Spongorhabdus nitratireducens]
MRCSIIIPVLNEADQIVATLQPLQPWRAKGHEVVLVDGGSEDHTCELATPLVDQVVTSGRGRALQMNTGARTASGDVLLFLHADTTLPKDGVEQVIENCSNDNGWGRFDVKLTPGHFLFPLIGFMISLRSRITGIASGDQAMFVTRELFNQVGGFPVQPLMEDIELSRQLKHIMAPQCLKSQVITSSRRWQEYGVVSTILLMWRLRLRYYMGAAPETLAQEYRFTVRAKKGMLPSRSKQADK